VADEHPDDPSPWTRDDWVPDSAVPDAAVFADARRPGGPRRRAVDPTEPPPEDFDDPDGGDRSPRSSLGRKVVAGAVVGALLIGSAGALLRDGDDAPAAPANTSFADLAPTATSASRDTIPATTEGAVTVSPSRSGVAVEISDLIPPLVAGEVPTWFERQIAVPENLGSMTPTEVITLSQSGILSVTDFPGGRSRSVYLSEMGGSAQLAVGDRAIVAFDSTTLMQIRDGEPVVESTLSEGVIFVRSWTGTGNFVVTTPSAGPGAPERDLLLYADGSLEPLDNPFVAETSFFSRVFSPTGDALFSAPGGVYAVGPDRSVRRISTGTLLATGTRHWAIEECDGALRCAYSIVEWETGTVNAGALEAIERLGVLDPSTHISPDGRSITFRADTDGTGRREILDVTTGSTISAGRINQLVYPDSWATDSTGLFFTDRYLQFVEAATGVITQIDDFDAIRTVATGQFSR
jgi:hypothetical protein